MHTLHGFAKLVKQLRDVQKASGKGYKSPAESSTATALEQQVDAAVVAIGREFFPLEKHDAGSRPTG